MLGVSRGSVREAIHELVLKGLIERSPRRGTVVLDPSSGPIAGSLLTRMAGQDRTLVEVMDLRAAIEPPIAAWAALRATRADLRRLSELLSANEIGVSGAAAAELDQAFHAAVGAATHNRLLARLLELIGEWVHITRTEQLQSVHRRNLSAEGHRKIYEAIHRGDAQGASAAMREHVSRVAALIAPRSVPKLPAKRHTGAAAPFAKPTQMDGTARAREGGASDGHLREPGRG
jgi:GntR family transcriptional regulator, transcriptional repressor for pyruvate dehydrogenase complex